MQFTRHVGARFSQRVMSCCFILFHQRYPRPFMHILYFMLVNLFWLKTFWRLLLEWFARGLVFPPDSSFVDLRLIDGYIGRSRRYYALMWSRSWVWLRPCTTATMIFIRWACEAHSSFVSHRRCYVPTYDGCWRHSMACLRICLDGYKDGVLVGIGCVNATVW